MDFSHADGLQNAYKAEVDFENRIQNPNREWWEPIVSIGHFNATIDQASLVSGTAALRSISSSSNRTDYSLSSQPLNNLYLAGTTSSYEAIQAPMGPSATFDAPFTRVGSASYSVSSTPSDITIPHNLIRGISTELAGYELGLDNTTPPDRIQDARCSLQQQSQALSLPAETNDYDAVLADFQLGLGKSPQSDALTFNRAEYTTKNSPPEPYSHSVEDRQHAQSQDAIYLRSNEKSSLEHRSGPSTVLRNEHQLKPLSASESTPSNGLVPQEPSLVPLSTIPSISVLQTPPIVESWECDNCGTAFTTKGTKNLNRNKRRHRCPGTGPKFPCSMCPKSFNRGDTRLLHLRKWHPEVHREPARRRKGKTFE